MSSTEMEVARQGLGESLLDNSTSWLKRPSLALLNFYVFSMLLISATNGYDGSLLNGLQALPQWQSFMDSPSGAWLGFINAISLISTILAYPVVAFVNNKWGRKASLYIGYAFLILGTVLQTVANDHATYIVGRFFIGQPTAWFAGSAPLLISEIAYPTHRSSLTALYNCGWYLGSLLSAWLTYGTRNMDTSWSWRIPSLLQAGIPTLGLVGVIMCPESPRYLVANDRIEEARAMLVKYHGDGDAASPLATFELAEIEAALRSEKQAAEQSSWMYMTYGKGNKQRMLISISLGIFSQYCGNNVVTYYLTLVLNTAGITDYTEQSLINGFLQVWNLLVATTASFAVDKIGRRPLFLASTAGMFVSFVVITGLSGSFASSGSSATGIAVVPFLFLFFGSYCLAFTPLLFSYPTEIWSYMYRARGLALTSAVAYATNCLNTFVNPVALENIGWKYYFVFIAVLLISIGTVYKYYPETKNLTLEEIAHVFDGPGVLEGVEDIVLELQTKGNMKKSEV